MNFLINNEIHVHSNENAFHSICSQSFIKTNSLVSIGNNISEIVDNINENTFKVNKIIKRNGEKSIIVGIFKIPFENIKYDITWDVNKKLSGRIWVQTIESHMVYL
jgi:hypothetical protein